MGITSSSNSGTELQVLSQKLVYPCREVVGKSFEELWMRESKAIWKTSDKFSEFVEGGDCKESFRALLACVEEAGTGSIKCEERSLTFFNCLYSHPDYYKPILSVIKTVVEQADKDYEAIHVRKQALSDDAFAARNQAFRDKLRGFR